MPAAVFPQAVHGLHALLHAGGIQYRRPLADTVADPHLERFLIDRMQAGAIRGCLRNQRLDGIAPDVDDRHPVLHS